jgi:uncharacterized protein (DUF58 family)
MEEKDFFRKIKQIEVIASRLVESVLSGNYRSVFRGQGIEFDEVRDYIDSDDARLIDWNVTSRMGNPFTKVFREEREITLFLVVDCSASLFTGPGTARKFDIASFVFALLGISAVVNSDRVGGVFFSDRIEKWVPPIKGKRNVLRIISDLLTMKPVGRGSNLALALRAVGKFLKRKSICVIVSDFKTAGYLHEMSIVARKHDCIAVRLCDDDEFEFPVHGTVELEDPETGRTVLAAGNEAGFRKAYASYRKHTVRRLADECAHRRVDLIELAVSDDPAVKLAEFFDRRRRRWRR